MLQLPSQFKIINVQLTAMKKYFTSLCRIFFAQCTNEADVAPVLKLNFLGHLPLLFFGLLYQRINNKLSLGASHNQKQQLLLFLWWRRRRWNIMSEHFLREELQLCRIWLLLTVQWKTWLTCITLKQTSLHYENTIYSYNVTVVVSFLSITNSNYSVI